MVSDVWRRMVFSEAVDINPATPISRGELLPFVEMQAVVPFMKYIPSPSWRKYTGGGARFQAGDTLLARITPCLENGKIAQFQSVEGKTRGHGSTEFIVLRGKRGITSTDFVYYLTTSEDVRRYAIGHMTGTSGRQRVPTNAFAHLTVSIPPIGVQDGIVSILGALDEKIELNRRMNQDLQATAFSLFKSGLWILIRFTRERKVVHRWACHPSSLGCSPARSEKPSSYGSRPIGWSLKPLDGVAEFLNGLAMQKHPLRV